MRPTDMILGLMLTGLQFSNAAQEGMFTGKTGTVHFKSDAALEIIEAESTQLSGALNPATNGIAFSLRINSFHGFNSVVQREHFMENYMEVTKYPVATFTGKIIEQINFAQGGEYDVRVKGILNVHGVNKERIIAGRLIINGDSIVVRASFSVPINEHDINIPKLLSQKIAETIYVEINIEMQKAE